MNQELCVCMCYTLVITPLPTYGTFLDVCCPRSIVSNNDSIRIGEWAYKVLDPMGDTGCGSVVYSNGFRIGVNSNVGMIASCCGHAEDGKCLN